MLKETKSAPFIIRRLGHLRIILRELTGVLLFGGVFAVVGGGVGWHYHSVARFGQGATVQGEVASLQSKRGRDGKWSCRAKIRYVVAGEEYLYEDFASRSPCHVRKDDPVELFYDPDDPSRSRVRSKIFGWGFPAVFFGFGLLILSFGLAQGWSAWRAIDQGARQDDEESR